MREPDGVLRIMHDGVMITYDEGSNTWKFTLRGRDKSADSLSKAKATIDKPAPASKAKPFEKIRAWFFQYGNEPQKVEITGIAERRIGQSDEVWINNNGNRSKQRTDFLFPASEKNNSIISQIIENDRKIKAFVLYLRVPVTEPKPSWASFMKSATSVVDRLYRDNENMKNRLQPLVLPKDEDTE